MRYTHYALRAPGRGRMASKWSAGGLLRSAVLLGEGLGNLRNAVLPELAGAPYAARLLLAGVQSLGRRCRQALRRQDQPPAGSVRSQAPTGYQIVFRKVSNFETVERSN